MKNEKRTNDFGRETKPIVASKDLRLTAYYMASPIDTFLHHQHKSPHSASKSIRVTSDIYMLFNQIRLDNMTRTQLLNHVQNMVTREPSLASLKSKLTDDQLCSILKSRYVQTPSELLSYSKYLNSLADQELQAYLASLPNDPADINDPDSKDSVDPNSKPIE